MQWLGKKVGTCVVIVMAHISTKWDAKGLAAKGTYRGELPYSVAQGRNEGLGHRGPS